MAWFEELGLACARGHLDDELAAQLHRADLPVVTPLEAGVDHVRGDRAAPVILEYGDYECPYSRKAFRGVEAVERMHPGRVRFAFRHFPLTTKHPHALAASAAAEAASRQGRFWEMHDLLFHGQRALEAHDLRRYADRLGLDPACFEHDRLGIDVAARIARDVESGRASGQVHGTPTLFIDGVVYRGAYDVVGLLDAVSLLGNDPE
jgi:protein-disulfide isomerase